MTIQDDGQGYDPASQQEGFGLVGIRERAHRLKASLEIVSEPGQGTRIELVAAKPASSL